jgi:hypothetical protein
VPRDGVENMHADGAFEDSDTPALNRALRNALYGPLRVTTPFFSRDRRTGEPRADVSDETTLAGHPQALLALAKLMTERCDQTETRGRLLRHGIMHGRELGYGTRRNSTQALATLLAVITWAQPIARARLDEAAAAREARYAGSDERDERGRRLDRRGFAQAKDSSSTLGQFQERFYERHGRYAASVDEIDPDGVLRDMF